MPARSISLWLASSASAGASLRVARKYRDTRMACPAPGEKRAFYVKRIRAADARRRAILVVQRTTITGSFEW
jgi:hypothetical protein